MKFASVLRGLVVGSAVAAGVYVTFAGLAWWRYGCPRPDPAEGDSLLDTFMPHYEVVERHQITVGAPAGITLGAARDQDLMQSGPVRVIFRARELALGATPDSRPRPRGLIDLTTSLGWGILAEVPGREVVVGAVTRPWEADVTFRALPPEAFAAFHEPGYVKIAWTLRADPVGGERSIFRTETRAIATDATARTRFRQYWALASPGISSIRWLSLRPLKQEAERRAREMLQAHSEIPGGLHDPAR